MTLDNLFFSLVVPQYTDVNTIGLFVHTSCSLLDATVPERFELLFVTHESDLAENMKTLQSDCPALRLVMSQEQPVVAGWEHAEGNVLGFLDGEITPEDKVLTQVVKTIEEGSDLAIAGLYGEAETQTEPRLGCFMIRRQQLSTFKNSKSGQVILLEVLGPEGAKNVKRFADAHG